MSYLYFDESIREHGEFIIGALVKSDQDLTPPIHRQWVDMGLDPTTDEYKSSATKTDSETSREQRRFLRGMLQRAGLGLTVSPLHKRTDLGKHCVELVLQLLPRRRLRPHGREGFPLNVHHLRNVSQLHGPYLASGLYSAHICRSSPRTLTGLL